MFALPYIIIAISGFTIFLMLTKKPRYNFDLILSVLVFCIGFQHIYHILLNNGIHSSFLPLRSGAYPLTFGPLLYLYFSFLSQENVKFKFTYILHCLPFLALFLSEAIWGNNLQEPVKDVRLPNFPLSPNIYVLLIFFSVLFYSVILLFQMEKHKKNITNYFSNISLWKDLTWMYWMIGVYVLSNTIIPLIHFFFHENPPYIFVMANSAALLLLTMGLCYFGIRQTIVFTHSESKNQKPEIMKEFVNVVQEENEKYKRSNLKKEEISMITEKIKTYMEIQKPFLDPDFTIETMSHDLGISKHKLSQSLNEGINTSFYAIVNEYRIEEIKLEIKKNIDDRLNFLNLAFAKGFNSKSTFNNAFKKLTGMTPSQYKNKLIA
ncbi:MAG: helix-turn-helix transcriptional regulator [Leptospiraceae bacterium]|nr:helix-turn-helix transcriptional regulator [Leptospiraceae bacterium]